MDNRQGDKLKMKYIALAAAVGAVLFILLAFGNLGREWTAAKNGTPAESAAESAGEASDSGAGDTISSETVSGAERTGTSSGAASAGSGDSGAEEAGASSVETTNSAQSGNNVDITITATGDVTLGRDENLDYDRSMLSFYDSYGASYFLEHMKDTLASDDLTVINFEGTLTTSDDRADKTYAFRADPSWVDVLTDGSVEAADIANNHTADYGKEGREDTENALAAAGIDWFGYDHSVVVDVKGIKVGIVGILELYDGLDSRDSITEQIDSVKSEGAQLVLCCMHWGDEGSYQPSDEQLELGKAAVDAGADIVIGHHPHRLQRIEEYNGKYILYSLGNFCFGGNSAPSDMDSAVAQQTFHFENGTLASADELKTIPISISSAEDYNNYQPTPFEEGSEGYERVLTKLRGEWSTDTGTGTEQYSGQ